MKTTIQIAFLFFTTIFYSQSIKLDGFITDSKSLGLEMANVMAVNRDTKAMDSYAITNDKGKFSLNLKAKLLLRMHPENEKQVLHTQHPDHIHCLQ